MYEKILVPLDGSLLAEVALPYAEELCGRLGSEIILLHIGTLLDDPKQHMHQFYIERMVELVRQGAEKYVQKFEGRSNIRVKSEVFLGLPAEKIVEYADQEGVDLIIMATHGQSGLKQWALGSIAEKVVRATVRPVALIRARGARPDLREKGTLNKALVPLDGSKEAEAIIPYVEELAFKLKVKVTLLQVLASGYATPYIYIPLTEEQMASDKASALNYLNNIAARLKGKGISVTTEEEFGIEIRFGNAAEEIIQMAEKIQADVVAMTTHGRSGFRRWVFGSVAERILREGNTPLLLVRPPNV